MSPHFHVPYLLPTALLAIALAFKTPTFLRAWRDPDVRATTLLLTWATAVLVVINPINIHRLNVLTGVPNIAAPWAYSFLTAFNATGLTMIIRWREAPSEGRRRRMIRIYWIYAAVGVGLWATFLLAHAPEPRVYDLDTYYACTPWMREHILLYVLAHMVSALVATYMLWRWLPEVTNRWLKTGVVFLQLGFASGLVFDVTKLIAVSARWFGADLDVLSTKAAPPSRSWKPFWSPSGSSPRRPGLPCNGGAGTSVTTGGCGPCGAWSASSGPPRPPPGSASGPRSICA